MNVKLSKIKNCGDNNQIIKISENSTMTMNDDCEIFSNICADVNAYNQAMVRRKNLNYDTRKYLLKF